MVVDEALPVAEDGAGLLWRHRLVKEECCSKMQSVDTLDSDLTVEEITCRFTPVCRTIGGSSRAVAAPPIFGSNDRPWPVKWILRMY